MNIQPTPLPGLFEVSHTPFRDARGLFERLFCAGALSPILGERRIMAVNHSRTTAVGALRGLHFQRPPAAEMKLVRCLAGRVLDVAVDIRAGSPTFLRHHAAVLSGDNGRMVVVPEGFAHGFQVLEADSELLYLHTAPYVPQAEGGLAWDDPALAITWPLAVTDLSGRDREHPRIGPDFEGIRL
ncbi:dTDP-4-dehydrorhamnose 3,5-epimerase family protein [Solidesulfovibrio sp.]|uniref:dTDP-4-dehydrorhamnose 3,5-epimerase family protein n=1 Tax=Solidesulfovibrio sp. TaxID=2910990 RepID=UPI0026299AC3|nr:dTDP-4-dehydrorhamnose 3,5-epimerase family protein [Solidesulfovibrio sp.]